MRPTGPMYDLPTPKFAIGDRLDRATLMDGHYDFEKGWYRRDILRNLVRSYRAWKTENQPGPGPIVPGHKRVIRHYMNLIDNAYSVEVSGVMMRTSQNENSLANQCYVGNGGSGWSGSRCEATVLFRGELPDDHRPGETNHEATNVTTTTWPEHRILEAIRVYNVKNRGQVG